MERWREVTGTNGRLMVSDCGRVKNTITGKVLSPFDNGCGYKKVHIDERRKAYVHRLVAEAFIPNQEGLKEVNHKDSNRSNNHLSNLEWVSSSGNTIHAVRKGRLIPWNNAPRAIVAKKDGKEMFFETISSAERYFKTRHINLVLKGDRKTAKGWTFSYAEGGDANANDQPRRTEHKAETVSA